MYRMNSPSSIIQINKGIAKVVDNTIHVGVGCITSFTNIYYLLYYVCITAATYNAANTRHTPDLFHDDMLITATVLKPIMQSLADNRIAYDHSGH